MDSIRLIGATVRALAPEAESASVRALDEVFGGGGRRISTELKREGLELGRIGSDGRLSRSRFDELSSIFKHEPIVYTPKPQELEAYSHLRTGVVLDRSGAKVPVVERALNPVKAAVELKVQGVHELSPFTSYMPVTVERTPGVIVQEKVGLSLEDWAKRADQRFYGGSREWDYDYVPPSFRDYLKGNAVFAEQMEQAQVERSILGDFDSTPANFGLSLRTGRPVVANLDMNQAFELAAKPARPNIISLQSRPLSFETQTKVESFLNTIESSKGIDALKRLRLNDQEIQSMQFRVDWFARNKRL